MCFPYLVTNNKQKLMPKSINKCVFICYDLHYKGYRCLEPISGRVYTLRNVTFDELTFPFNELSSRNTHTPQYTLLRYLQLKLNLLWLPLFPSRQMTILQVHFNLPHVPPMIAQQKVLCLPQQQWASILTVPTLAPKL